MAESEEPYVIGLEEHYWDPAVGSRTAFIEPGSPWENGYIESFNAGLRDELLDGEIFYTSLALIPPSTTSSAPVT